MKRGIIFCGGEMKSDTVWLPEYKDSLILCADGGLKYAKRLGIVPDMVIGDLDSGISSYDDIKEYKIYPSEKDKTDTNLCLDYAIEKGCDEIILIGALGGRIDHEFSHYCLMLYGLKKGVRVKVIDEQNEIWMEDKPFELFPSDKKYISFFPFGGDVEEFSVRGLKYIAEDITLYCGAVQASSNQFDGNGKAEISFKDGGIVLVIRSSDKK